MGSLRRERALGIGLLLVGLGIGFDQASAGASAPVRDHLLVVVDGIAFPTIESLRAEGVFEGFQPPVRMLATFPSTSEPSLSEMFHCYGSPRPSGYENRHFDITRNRIRGGRLWDYQEYFPPFRELIDYHQDNLGFKLQIYLRPLRQALREVDNLRRRLLDSPGSLETVYLSTSDAVGHTRGHEGHAAVLRALDAALDDVRRAHRERYGRTLRVSLVSDHGIHVQPMRPVRFVRTLRDAGFRVRSRLRRPGDVVHPAWGFIGAGIFFADPADAESLARTLAGVDGVDVAAYDDGAGIHALGDGGRSRIDVRGDRYRYVAVDGDPLALGSFQQTLTREGRTDLEGFATRGDWFEATVDHLYPDVAGRLVAAFRTLVRNPATVLVSLDDGRYVHRGLTQLGLSVLGKPLAGTHGSLRASSTEGFLMTDWTALTGPVDSSRALASLATAGSGVIVECAATPQAAVGGR